MEHKLRTESVYDRKVSLTTLDKLSLTLLPNSRSLLSRKFKTFDRFTVSRQSALLYYLTHFSGTLPPVSVVVEGVVR